MKFIKSRYRNFLLDKSLCQLLRLSTSAKVNTDVLVSENKQISSFFVGLYFYINRNNNTNPFFIQSTL